METLSCLIKRAISKGYLTNCRVKRRGGEGVQLTHIPYVNDTLIFYEAWLLIWFEAIFGQKINLDKSEILLVGRVENLEKLALKLGCKVGMLPSSYLGLPLSTLHK